MPLSSRLRRLRLAHGISQAELARRMGVSQMAISKIELHQGDRTSAYVVSKLCRAIGVPHPDFLLYGDLAETLGFVLQGNLDMALLSIQETFRDHQRAGLDGRADSMLCAMDVRDFPSEVIVATLIVSSWRRDHLPWHALRTRAWAVLSERHGEAGARRLLGGI